MQQLYLWLFFAAPQAKLNIPFNIVQSNGVGEAILRNSGIKDWEEELTYLKQQLEPEQIGCCDGFDMRQAKIDRTVLKDQERKERAAQSVKLEEEAQFRAIS